MRSPTCRRARHRKRDRRPPTQAGPDGIPITSKTTAAAPRLGRSAGPAYNACGVCPGRCANRTMHPLTPDVEVVTRLPGLPARDPEAHKGSYGRVLVVAGSRGMTGAAVLCASAALRGGAGLVRLAVPEEVLPVVAVANPCYLTAPLPQDEQGQPDHRALAPILPLARSNDVMALG